MLRSRACCLQGSVGTKSMIKEVPVVKTKAGILKPMEVEPATMSLIGIVFHL